MGFDFNRYYGEATPGFEPFKTASPANLPLVRAIFSSGGRRRLLGVTKTDGDYEASLPFEIAAVDFFDPRFCDAISAGGSPAEIAIRASFLGVGPDKMAWFCRSAATALRKDLRRRRENGRRRGANKLERCQNSVLEAFRHFCSGAASFYGAGGHKRLINIKRFF